METLSAHNRRAAEADVACDKCQSPMEYDLELENEERFSGAPRLYSRPVRCTNPNCTFTGRKDPKGR